MKTKFRRYIKLGLGGILAVSLAFAAWVLLAESGFTGHVTSTSGTPIYFSVDFDDVNLNTTLSAESANTSAVVTNSDGTQSMSLSIQENVTDIDDSCVDYENDCSLTYSFNGQTVEDGETVTVYSGNSNFEAELSCVQLSCPQDVTVAVSLS